MKIFHSKQIPEIDAYTIKNEPVASIDLMERASLKLCEWLIERYHQEQSFKIFVGPGNNGGDGLALARLLSEANFQVEVYLVKITRHLSADCQMNLDRLKIQNSSSISEISSLVDLPIFSKGTIVIDALFGSGLSRPLDDLVKDIVKTINDADVEVISIDIPSGLFGEDNSSNDLNNCVHADYTLSFEFPKLSFLFPENAECVGIWETLPIGLHPAVIEEMESPYQLIDENYIRSLLKTRLRFSHKGTYGHGLLISGSYGKMGAAILASKACLRSGIGLLSTHIPRLGYDILQTAVPESMVSIDRSDIIFTEYPNLENFDAIGIGPGIDIKCNSIRALEELLEECDKPLVLDADALNIIGANQEMKKYLPKGTILTPHIKEFERLFGECKGPFDRNEKQRNFSKKQSVVMVLKGAFTAITDENGRCYFNPTGNPGMATAGSGDVLTGIILSLLAQGYSSLHAALVGVFIHGLAGDLAADEYGEDALIASDIISFLPQAWKRIKS
ncbi:NAD(P)H-hydrate dehydratase [Ancylomarina euxinus]|uniref:Bifunctional NAD(P)H-hydrate repair enzyme n=1 Tax=Ancylomarina euxinus TaxID=2283627 RepID=A0A425Y5Z1_9BACT|nr:NAD(P)H-hydrate dehydratase [Ancylomarina euxinus]MCZ4694268.1 NAD(P)H-hydrate dehydratase [Ancylomarina euxinus]MUP14400.1 NAD(P)H-hydrate dehydratase [Ancylomarina euxinus]RRG23709.1 NAD(P)H-hydrate dehydratase [Ancylomarina euxinus]